MRLTGLTKSVLLAGIAAQLLGQPDVGADHGPGAAHRLPPVMLHRNSTPLLTLRSHPVSPGWRNSACRHTARLP